MEEEVSLDDINELRMKEVKKEIKWIYKDLENLDFKYESLIQER